MMDGLDRYLEDAMKRAPVHVLGCLLGLGLFATAQVAEARSVSLVPRTTHPALTLNTDGSYGFQPSPGAPLTVDMVGPGALVFTVRLNHTKKLPAFSGELELKRAGKLIKRDKLNLFRSRVGAYREDKRLQPSNPKSFKLKVPNGLQSYSVSLKAPKGTSMTLSIAYDSDADQTAALPADDMALVPLVPPGGDGPGMDDIPLVPLAPVDTGKPPADAVALAPTGPGTDKPIAKPVDKPIAKPVDKPIAKPVDKPIDAPRDKPPPDRPVEPVKVAVAPSDKPAPATKVETIEGKAARPPEVTGEAVEVPPVISLGVKVGQITPLQSIGATSVTGSLDLRWIVPGVDGNLSLGVEVGYHQYGLTVTDRDLESELKVIPVALQLYYAIPLGDLFQLFLGGGGDMYVVLSETRYASAPSASLSGTSFAFGGHVCAGAELALGPGFLGLELRAGFTSADVTGMSNVNVAGLSSVLGYRLVF